MLWIKLNPPVACKRACTQARTSPVFLRRPSFCSPALIVTQVWKKPPLEAHPWLPLWSSPKGGHTLVGPSTPPPLHFSTVCHGCFKTIWPGCANGWLFWERDGKTVCYSRRPSEKKKRGIAKREWSPKRVEGRPVYACVENMSVCVCVCVRNQPYQRLSVVLGSYVADDHRDRCWN